MRKPCESHESHIEAARTGMLAVFGECAMILKPRKRKATLVAEGTVVVLRRIESDGKDVLKIWGTENKDDDWRKVRSADVRIYMGRVPDWQMEMYLVEHGYQCDTYAGVQPLCIRCRDFGGNHKIEDLIIRLERLSDGWVEMFKRKL